MKKSILSIVSAVVSVAWATEFNASVQGDIASVAYWQSLGYSSLPGINDTLKVYGRATDPMFSAGSDMSIGSLVISASGSFIDLTSPDNTLRTITLNSSTNAMEFTKDGASYKLIGGKWYLANKGHVYCGRANKGSMDNHTIEFNGCIITNAARFYAAYCDRSTTLKITNGAEIYTDNLYPAYGKYSSNSLITVSGGSKLVSIDRMIQGDGFNDVYEEGVSEVGNNRIEVSGEGSLLKLGGESLYGHRVPHNLIEIREGAQFVCGMLKVGNMPGYSGFDSVVSLAGHGTSANTGGIELGNSESSYKCGLVLSDGADWNSSSSLTVGNVSYGNYASFSSSTGSCGSVILGAGATASNNVLMVDSGSKLEVRSGNFLKVGVGGCSNRAEIVNSTVTFPGNGTFLVGEKASSSCNVLRIAGEKTLISISNDSFDPFGLGSSNIVELADGARMGGQYYFATNSVCNRFVVRNATLDSGLHAHLGVQNSAVSRGNALEILDGGVARFMSLSISARDNTLFVSNSSFSVSESTGMRIGFGKDPANNVSNCTVHIAGDNVSVNSAGSLSLDKFSRLHFSIPRKGWKTSPVKVLSLSCGANTVITADCEEFCNHTGGGIVLVETVNGIDNKRIEMVLSAANAKLPSKARFYVSGNNLMFRAPHVKGTVVVVR